MALTAKWSDFSNLDGEQLQRLVNERLPKWVALALVILIAWQLAHIIWALVPVSADGDTISPPLSQAANGPAAAASGQPNVSMIAGSHLFGEASATQAAPIATPSSDIETLPDARAGLLLKGTVTASDTQPSIAIIADSSKQEKIYKIGDPVTTGTTLHDVYKDLVVLSRNGALSKLELPKDFVPGTASLRRTPTVNRQAGSNRSIQTVVAQNVSKLADVIRPTPYFKNGQQQGYRVYPGRDRKQFAALGLRPGDLIKDIDGASLTDPRQAMEIFQNLGTADQVSVTVERNGQPQVLVLKTSQLEVNTDN